MSHLKAALTHYDHARQTHEEATARRIAENYLRRKEPTVGHMGAAELIAGALAMRATARINAAAAAITGRMGI